MHEEKSNAKKLVAIVGHEIDELMTFVVLLKNFPFFYRLIISRLKTEEKRISFLKTKIMI